MNNIPRPVITPEVTAIMTEMANNFNSADSSVKLAFLSLVDADLLLEGLQLVRERRWRAITTMPLSCDSMQFKVAAADYREDQDDLQSLAAAIRNLHNVQPGEL
jgi:hypothetical protein